MRGFIIGRYAKREQRGNVIGTTQNFSTRMAVKGLLCAAVAALVLIEAFVLASSARAAEATVQPEGSTPAQELLAPVHEAPTAEEAPGAKESTPPPPEEQTQPAEEASSTESTPPPVEEATPPVETTPPIEEVAPPVETTPPVEEVAPPVETTPPVQTTPPVEEVTPPASKEVVVPTSDVTAPVEEQVKPVESAKEAAPTEQVTAPVVVSSPSAPQAAATTTPVSAQAVAEAPGALLGAFPPVPAGESPERSSPPTSARTSIGMPGQLTAAQRAGELSCQLSGLTRRMSEDCSASLLPSGSLLSVASEERVAELSPARKSARTGGGYSEPVGGGRSVLPPPGPAPGGSFGGSAAGGSGIALSGFFTPAGVLHFAVPCAMRRLRLSCRPWRTAFFVLIPERPG